MEKEIASLQPAYYDLSRKSSYLRSIVTKKFLARIFAELMGKKAVRFAFDQYLTAPPKLTHSFQGYLGGTLVFLGPKGGDALFFTPQASLPPFETALFISYTEPKTLYIYNPEDPHTHFLKTLGYSFGDCLKESTHPLLYSREL